MYSDKRRLRIGFYTDNGIFPPVHSCQRAVLVAKAILAKAGHEVNNNQWGKLAPDNTNIQCTGIL